MAIRVPYDPIRDAQGPSEVGPRLLLVRAFPYPVPVPVPVTHLPLNTPFPPHADPRAAAPIGQANTLYASLVPEPGLGRFQYRVVTPLPDTCTALLTPNPLARKDRSTSTSWSPSPPLSDPPPLPTPPVVPLPLPPLPESFLLSGVQDDESELRGLTGGAAQTPKCRKCGKHFVSAASLNAHHRRKHEDHSVHCAQCGKRCATIADLRSHERVHNGERPFGCDLCEYRAARKPDLRRHVFTHQGASSFKCQFCQDVKCRSLNGLISHMVSCHPELPFRCPTCAYGARELVDLELHVSREHRK